jgi:hypothetical protein
MVQTVGIVCIGLAAGALAAGFALAGWGVWAGGIAIVGTLWLFSRWRGVAWAAPVALVSSAGVAVTGLWLEVGAGWMVCGLLAALCAWDLDRFAVLLGKVDSVDEQRALEIRHLMRLLLVAFSGAGLAALALSMELTLSFVVVGLSALLAVWGLGRALGFLRRESN